MVVYTWTIQVFINRYLRCKCRETNILEQQIIYYHVESTTVAKLSLRAHNCGCAPEPAMQISLGGDSL